MQLNCDKIDNTFGYTIIFDKGKPRRTNSEQNCAIFTSDHSSTCIACNHYLMSIFNSYFSIKL